MLDGLTIARSLLISVYAWVVGWSITPACDLPTLLVASALVVCYLPARRAAPVEANVTLRHAMCRDASATRCGMAAGTQRGHIRNGSNQ
jgi:hypothetical protein